MQGGYGPPQRQEITFFAEQGVQVTSSRFVVHGQLYPLAGITSVAPFTTPPKRLGLVALAAVFGFFTLASLGSLISRGAVLPLLVFAVLTALCIWGIRRQKATHGVLIATAGMQVKALTSPDVAFVQQVVGALHQAVASR